MKSLKSFIEESVRKSFINAGIIKESDDSKTILLSFDGIDGGADTIKSIKSMCSSDGVKFDDANLNDGIKITATKDKVETLDKISELVQTFISAIPNEKHEDIEKELDKLSSQLDKLEDTIAEFENGEDDKSDEDE